MTICHRNGDSRDCGATTTVVGQSFVKVNGQLWAVEGDPNTHGDGQLIHTQSYIKINSILVIRVNDPASADDLCPVDGGAHCDPIASSGDSMITVN